MSDDEIWRLNRGGHDQEKVYAAYDAAVRHTGQPTVILAKTIKGYGMGVSGEGQMIAHQAKKMTEAALLAFRDRFELPLTDQQVKDAEYYKPPDDAPEMVFLRECRARLGGSLPVRRQRAEPLQAPALALFKSQLDGTGEREVSTTMAFVRILAALLRDKTLGSGSCRSCPTSHARSGWRDVPPGRDLLPGRPALPAAGLRAADVLQGGPARPDPRGGHHRGRLDLLVHRRRHLYSPTATQMVPFYIYYSMFGYQRVGDLIWAAGDSRTRGFLMGGTAGRTTLNGEGLQHEDGHSHLLFSVVPNCRAYDPAFAYELAVIIQDGLHHMLDEQEDVFYYVTLMNENYQHPAMPDGVEDGILRGMYPLREALEAVAQAARAADGSGTILNEVIAAADLLESDWGVLADVWSVTSFTQLRRDGIEAERWNMLHPRRSRRAPRMSSSARRPSRAGDRLDRLHPRVPRPDPPVGAGRRSGCSAPTATAAATTAARCGASSRSTATT